MLVLHYRGAFFKMLTIFFSRLIQIKIRLLTVHASLKCYMFSSLRRQGDEISDEYLALLPLFAKSSTILGTYWLSFLKDYSCVHFHLHMDNVSTNYFCQSFYLFKLNMHHSEGNTCSLFYWPIGFSAHSGNHFLMEFNHQLFQLSCSHV